MPTARPREDGARGNAVATLHGSQTNVARLARMPQAREGILRAMNPPTPDFWKPVGSLTAEDLTTLIGKPERSVLDYKQAQNPSDMDADKMAEDLCAFANVGLGRLVIGAEEGDRDQAARLSGVPAALVKSCRSKLRNAAHAVQPAVHLDIQEIEVTGGRFVIVVEIRRASFGGPHQFRGKYGTRSSDGNTFMLHSSVVQAILADHGSTARSWTVPKEGFGTVTPFGAGGGTGWFFGVEISLAHPPERSIFEVFDETGDRLAEAMVARTGRRPRKELTRLFVETDLMFGHACKRRLEIATDCRVAEFDQLNDASIEMPKLVAETGRARIADLATFVQMIAPAALVNVRMKLWGSTSTALTLGWRQGSGKLTAPQSFAEQIDRACLLAEISSPTSPLVEHFVWRTENRLRVLTGVEQVAWLDET